MKTLYPYDVLVGEVGIAVNTVTIDGKALSTNYIDPDLLEIAFVGLDHGWNEAVIRITVTAPAAELASNPSWESPMALVQITCGRSNTRQSVVLTADPHTPGRWTGSLELDRNAYYGRASLRAVIPATVDGVPHRIIGSTDTWTVSFDDLPPSPVHGSISVKWSDFANDDDRPYLEAFKTDPYYLRLDPDDPTLLLNSGFEGLEALLVDRKHRPKPELALHDSTRGNIASDVWKAMFIAALDSVELDPDTRLPEWPAEGWREVVLRCLLVRIYPDASPDDALVQAVHDRDASEGSGDLQERLLPAAARQVRNPQLLRKAIGLLEDDAHSKEDDK